MIRKRSIFGTFLILCGMGLVGLGGSLLMRNDKEDQAAQASVNESLPMVQEAIEERANLEILPGSMLSHTGVDAIDQLVDAKTEKMPVVELQGEAYIGLLQIPAVGMELPVFNEWNEQKLKRAPCRYYGSLDTSDLVIAGHNYKSSFGKLHRIHVGDEVYFTDMNGVTYFYTVQELEVLEATAVSNMIESEWDLSLYTCTYGGKQRLTVRCRLSEEQNITQKE